jgi:hypothetical protein
VVVFRSLKAHHLREILEIELNLVQGRITESAGTKFVFECTAEAKEFLLAEGIDLKYGARHLKRAIERFLVYPLSNLVATEQVSTGDLVVVDLDKTGERLSFSKREGSLLVHHPAANDDEEKPRKKSDAASAGSPLAAAATEAVRVRKDKDNS